MTTLGQIYYLCKVYKHITLDSIRMTAVKFRYDFTDEEQTMHPMSVVSTYIRDRYPGAIGVETHNKYGEVIKRHMHYHFIHPSEDDKELDRFLGCIRRRFQRAFPGRSKGYYSITYEADVKDMDRIIRYPLKQYEKVSDIPNIVGWKYPDDFDVAVQWQLASEEYVRTREFMSSRREAKDRRQTTYEKIRQLIQDEDIKFATLREIFNFLLKYYDKEGIPVERSKIRSMMDSIALTVGLMSEDDYYRQVMA